MRKYLAGIWLLFLTIATGAMSCYTDRQPGKPKLIPKGYTIVRRGESMREAIHLVRFALCSFTRTGKIDLN